MLEEKKARTLERWLSRTLCGEDEQGDQENKMERLTWLKSRDLSLQEGRQVRTQVFSGGD